MSSVATDTSHVNDDDEEVEHRRYDPGPQASFVPASVRLLLSPRARAMVPLGLSLSDERALQKRPLHASLGGNDSVTSRVSQQSHATSATTLSERAAKKAAEEGAGEYLAKVGVPPARRHTIELGGYFAAPTLRPKLTLFHELRGFFDQVISRSHLTPSFFLSSSTRAGGRSPHHRCRARAIASPSAAHTSLLFRARRQINVSPSVARLTVPHCRAVAVAVLSRLAPPRPQGYRLHCVRRALQRTMRARDWGCKQLFDSIDADGDGCVDANELRGALEAAGVRVRAMEFDALMEVCYR